MTSKWTPLTLFALCTATTACDAQHGAAYPGQALWTLLGSIVTDDARIDADTSAAIYWSNAGRHLDVLEQVEVEGDFPAEFTLRAFEPPPEPAQISLSDVGLAALDIAFGLVVAVDRESAPFYPRVTSTTEDNDAVLAPGETLIEGDDRAWLRGGAPGHLVAYLSDDPPASAACLAEFTAGYNLLALTPKTSTEIEAGELCEQRALDGALELYNAQRGTALTEEDLWDDEAARTLVERTAVQLECANGCGLFKLKATVVPPETRVTLEMQANPELVDWF